MTTSNISAQPSATTAEIGRNFDFTRLTSACTLFFNVCSKRISLMYAIYNERRQLQQLSSERLQDLGITRAQLNAESQRKITDIPTNRL